MGGEQGIEERIDVPGAEDAGRRVPSYVKHACHAIAGNPPGEAAKTAQVEAPGNPGLHPHAATPPRRADRKPFPQNLLA
jgi:hypothetical protein